MTESAESDNKLGKYGGLVKVSAVVTFDRMVKYDHHWWVRDEM